MGSSGYVANDWGTTNRRACLKGEDGAVLDGHSDNCGILSLAPDDSVRDISQFRECRGAESVIIEGLAGVSRGWLAAGANGFGIASNLYRPGKSTADLIRDARLFIQIQKDRS